MLQALQALGQVFIVDLGVKGPPALFTQPVGAVDVESKRREIGQKYTQLNVYMWGHLWCTYGIWAKL